MSNKQTLFLLPGLLCDEAVWTHQREALEPYADVVIPLFRGFSSLEKMAVSVLEQAPERFSVIGHSMGGRIAFELMRIAGNRIDKFAVLDTGTHGLKVGETENRQAMLDLAESDGLEAVAKAWIPIMTHPSRHNDEVLFKEITEMILRNTVDEYKGQVNALLSRENQSEYLAAIEQKVLLVCGDEDSWCPVSQHEEIASGLKYSQLTVVGECGHMSTMEKPEMITQILLNWYQNNHA